MAYITWRSSSTQQPGKTRACLYIHLLHQGMCVTIDFVMQGVVNNKQLFKANATLTYQCAEVSEVLLPNFCAIGSWSEWQVCDEHQPLVSLAIH